MLVTVPAVLLLLDYWPLGRWRSLECDGLPPLSETHEHITDDVVPVMQSEGESSFPWNAKKGMALNTWSSRCRPIRRIRTPSRYWML